MDGGTDSGTVVPDGGTEPGDGGTTDGGTPIPDGGSGTATLGRAGGTLTSGDGRLTIVVQRNTLARPATFSVQAANATLSANTLGGAYEITPSNEPIPTGYGARDVRATLRYGGLNLGDLSPYVLTIAQWDGKDWDPLETVTFDPTAMSITAKLTSFRPIALIGGLCTACKPCKADECPGGSCMPTGNGCSKCVIPCDTDGDTYCAGSNLPGGAQGGDCNPSDPTVNPRAPELPNERDDNCNQFVDEGFKKCTGNEGCEYGQACENGVCVLGLSECTMDSQCLFPRYVQPGEMQYAGKCVSYGVQNAAKKCVASCDKDQDGRCTTATNGAPGGDCDDNNAMVGYAPAGGGDPEETCGDGLDNDCKNGVDDGCTACTSDNDCTAMAPSCILGVCSACPTTCEAGACGAKGSGATCKSYGKGGACSLCSPACDSDGDGHCRTAVSNFPGDDCNDGSAAQHPSTEAFPVREICGNRVDDDCNGFEDDDCQACSKTTDCPAQLSCQGGTCRVCPAAPNPCVFGNTFETPPKPGVAGRVIDIGGGCSICVAPCDKDGDGFCTDADAMAAQTAAGAAVNPGTFKGGDCNDNDANISPEAPEICGDGVSNDCDAAVDEECGLCTASTGMCGMQEYCSNGR